MINEKNNLSLKYELNNTSLKFQNILNQKSI